MTVDARAVLELAGDLVPEHGARRGAAELLDVRAAETARAHAHEQRPAPAGSGRSASSGSPSASRTTARTALS